MQSLNLTLCFIKLIKNVFFFLSNISLIYNKKWKKTSLTFAHWIKKWKLLNTANYIITKAQGTNFISQGTLVFCKHRPQSSSIYMKFWHICFRDNFVISFSLHIAVPLKKLYFILLQTWFLLKQFWKFKLIKLPV